jgi:hypothetical protein
MFGAGLAALVVLMGLIATYVVENLNLATPKANPAFISILLVDVFNFASVASVYDLATRGCLYPAYVLGALWILTWQFIAEWLYVLPWWKTVSLHILGHWDRHPSINDRAIDSVWKVRPDLRDRQVRRLVEALPGSHDPIRRIRNLPVRSSRRRTQHRHPPSRHIQPVPRNNRRGCQAPRAR